MGLEVPSAKTPGDVIRVTPAERPAFIGLCILALTGIELLFAVLVFWAVANGANNAAAHDPKIPDFTLSIYFQDIRFFKNEQAIISFWLACIFFCLWYIIFLYQRFFKDHTTIAKRRFRKWEDEGVQLHE